MKKIFLILVVVVIGLVSWKFTVHQNPETKSIKIGVITALTGVAAEHGENIQKGIELAKEVLGSRVELVYQDSVCDPKRAIDAYRKLTGEGIRVIIGMICSGDTLAIAPLAEKDHVVLIASGATSPLISSAGDYVFRVVPSDAKDAALMLSYIKERNFKRISVIYLNNDYGKAIADILKPSLGDRLINIEGYTYADKDFRSLLTKSRKSEAIVLVGFPDTTALFLKQYRELGMTQTIMGSAGTMTVDLLSLNQDLLRNFIISSPDMAPNGRQNFISDYKAKFHRDPGFPSEYGLRCISGPGRGP